MKRNSHSSVLKSYYNVNIYVFKAAFFLDIVGMLTYFKWLYIIGCKYMTVSNAGERIKCIIKMTL